MKLEYKLLKEKVKEYNKKDAQFYGNIFAKMNKLEHLSSAVSPDIYVFHFLDETDTLMSNVLDEARPMVLRSFKICM